MGTDPPVRVRKKMMSRKKRIEPSEERGLAATPHGLATAEVRTMIVSIVIVAAGATTSMVTMKQCRPR